MVYRRMILEGEAIGALIKKLRERRGLSQRKLAFLSGIDRGYINQLEAGKGGSISLRLARALASALEISPEIFLKPGGTIEADSFEPELKIFFSNDWKTLDEEERDWVRRTIKMVKERKREREKYRAEGG